MAKINLKNSKKIIAVIMASLLLMPERAGAFKFSGNFWSERAHQIKPTPSAAQSKRPQPPRQILDAVNSFTRQSEQTPQFGTGPFILLIQDIHGNLEAQKNIGMALASLHQLQLPMVFGVEAAHGAFDFAPFRQYPDPRVVQAAADKLLMRNEISAPSWFGLTAAGRAPVVEGIDDPAIYQDNVASFLNSSEKRKPMGEIAHKTLINLKHRSQSELTSDEFKLFSEKYLYDEGSLSLPQYLAVLNENVSFAKFPQIEKYRRSVELEGRLNLEKAQVERAAFLALLKKNKLKIDDSFFDSALENKNKHKLAAAVLSQLKLSWADFSNLSDFLLYEETSDSLDLPELMNELVQVEKNCFNLKFSSKKSKEFFNSYLQIRFEEKLVDFELTSGEWNNHPAQVGEDFKTFIEFYEQAHLRSQKMADNLLAAMDKNKTQWGAMIVGGFHTEGLTQILKEREIAYAVVTPRFSIDSAQDGGAYLNEFLEKKSPLTTLFMGQRLNLASAQKNLGVVHWFKDYFPKGIGSLTVFFAGQAARDGVISRQEDHAVKSASLGAVGAFKLLDDGFKLVLNNLAKTEILMPFKTSANKKVVLINQSLARSNWLVRIKNLLTTSSVSVLLLIPTMGASNNGSFQGFSFVLGIIFTAAVIWLVRVTFNHYRNKFSPQKTEKLKQELKLLRRERENIYQSLNNSIGKPLEKMAVISDHHGGIDRFADFILDAFRSVLPPGPIHEPSFKLRPGRRIADQLQSVDVKINDLRGKIFFHNLGDFMDRGPHGIQIFRFSHELVRAGLSDFIIGNHDFGMMTNIQGLHLPWYDDYNFHGYADEYDQLDGHGPIAAVLKRRQESPGSYAESRNKNWWAERLAEYHQFHQDKQKNRWDKLKKEVRETWGTPSFVASAPDSPEGALWDKFIGKGFGIDVYKGLNGVGHMSVAWWREMLEAFEKVEAQRLGLNKDQDQVWSRAIKLMKEIIIPEVAEDLRKAVVDNKQWYWRAFEALNKGNYKTPEWSAKDWVFHKGWGTSVLLELNEFNLWENWAEANQVLQYLRSSEFAGLDDDLRSSSIEYLEELVLPILKVDIETAQAAGRWYWNSLDDWKSSEDPFSVHDWLKQPTGSKVNMELYVALKLDTLKNWKIWNAGNYLESEELGRIKDFYKDNFNLSLKDKYLRHYLHAFLPINDQGEFYFEHGGQTYKGPQIWEKLESLSAEVRNSGDSELGKLSELFSLIDSWYAEETTQAKQNYIAAALKKFGAKILAEGNGFYALFTGHVPMEKFAGFSDSTAEPDRAVSSFNVNQHLYFTDHSSSKEYGYYGAFIMMGSPGMEFRGFEGKEEPLINNPKTKNKKGDKILFENKGISADIFLRGLLADFDVEIAAKQQELMDSMGFASRLLSSSNFRLALSLIIVHLGGLFVLNSMIGSGGLVTQSTAVLPLFFISIKTGRKLKSITLKILNLGSLGILRPKELNPEALRTDGDFKAGPSPVDNLIEGFPDLNQHHLNDLLNKKSRLGRLLRKAA